MLVCVAQNNLDAPNNLSFAWRHNDSNIRDDDSCCMITSFPENAEREARSVLVVMSVTRSDGGMYECVAFNREITDGDDESDNVTVYCKWSVLFTVVTANGYACNL